MARKKITQNVNKDAGLLDLPNVNVPSSKWMTKHSNYLTCNIGDIVPIYVDEILPGEKRKVTMGMLSHMTTPIAPIFNAQYTEFRAFWVPNRLICDLFGGYKTRKSPWVKVFGEDNSSESAKIIVPLEEQKLPSISSNLMADFMSDLSAFGGLADSLDMDFSNESYVFEHCNFLSLGAYELIYQKAYRNENRESATNSSLYRWCYNLYNRTSALGVSFSDAFHKANREKDYYTGAQPFTQKGEPVRAGLVGEVPVVGTEDLSVTGQTLGTIDISDNFVYIEDGIGNGSSLRVNLASAQGISIEELRILIKTQEMLEKDMMYGSDYASSLNAHFGTAPISTELEEPLELNKVTITSEMQAIFQTSTTTGEQTILGTIGANSTTRSGEFEIVPYREFREHGYLIICAVHKAQNSYDSLDYKPKHLFKQKRFDFYTPELNDLGFQPVSRLEFTPGSNTGDLLESVGFNEAWAEYRFKANRVHGMFEPSRENALSYWTLAMSDYDDIASIYKQSEIELNRAISIDSENAPQFYDAYGFIEVVEKPMSLHSIPGMDGVI